MIKSQDQDEFIAVRVQDPRTQNEGSWNSYVDFKIFLHTNSKAFTAKTSCVRRRYSEFVWLRKKLQKNAGLVPVPELPSKSLFFSFTNEDFIEKRRKGLQSFLDKVVHMTVCLSDSQLHLFLQTQLPVSHIQDCVQGLTPYTVTDAILTYASSNQGWTQEEDSDTQEQCPTPVPYESMESPSPHMPSSQCGPPVTLTASKEAGAAAAVSDSVTVDVHDVNVVELTADAQSEKAHEGESHGDRAPVGDAHAEAIVEVHPQGVDLIIVDQEDAIAEGNATEGAQQSNGGFEDAALEAVDQVERLLNQVGLLEETVTDQYQEVTSEAILKVTDQGSSSEEQNEVVEVTSEDTTNVELSQQEESCLNSASDNDNSVLEASVVPQSLSESNHDGGVAETDSLQDNSETSVGKNGPVEEQCEDQSQNRERDVEMTPSREESGMEADLDEGVCVDKAEEEETTGEVLQSVLLQSLDHCEEESNNTNRLMSNGHNSDNSVTSAMEDSTEEAPDCEKMISSNVIESVVSDSTEDRTVNLEETLEGCDLKGQICHDQIELPYTDLSASEGGEEDPHGVAIQ
ncbi:sorting nexin-11 [Alosa alosa]|nr:sorting nexin-11 [Alosa alosa]XP_048088364.1 sorting nexin-11 [Alosa alosa]